MSDDAARARRIIDAHVYMTLATADSAGRPWASPVWFAHENYERFVWVSKPEARHSQNLAARPQAAAVIFDSTAGTGAPDGVYLDVEAQQAVKPDDERFIGVFAGRSEALGLPGWSLEDVRPPARLRLYVARASALFVLGANDERIAVSLS